MQCANFGICVQLPHCKQHIAQQPLTTAEINYNFQNILQQFSNNTSVPVAFTYTEQGQSVIPNAIGIQHTARTFAVRPKVAQAPINCELNLFHHLNEMQNPLQ